MEKCTEAVVKWLFQNNTISEEEEALYKYALQSAMLSVLPILFAGIIGLLSGSVICGIVLVLPFMFLRKFSGGYHAKKLIYCIISSACLLFLCINMVTKIQCDWKLVAFTALASISLMIFSPIDNENRRLDNEEKHRYRKRTVYRICFFDLVGMVLILLHCREYAVCIFIGIQMAAWLQIPCIAKKYLLRPKRNSKCRFAHMGLKLETK